EGIVHRKENDGFSILFNPQKGNTAILDGNACFIWDCCEKSVSVEDIIKSIHETFASIKVKNLDERVQSVLTDLHEKGFLDCLEKNNG
ncbi:MAG: PqqD family protein, partial [Candidatus Aminicenantes bacterium]|nr:PqqD family protein [Candidatus Aminicenantes bacterium]